MTFPRLCSIAEHVAAQALRRLPDELRGAAERCRIEMACMGEIMEFEAGLDDDLLGLFEGNSRFDREPESPEELPRIRLFLDNLWDFADRDLRVFRDEVRITLLHELGHYLGLDEQQVEELGLA